ncbi:MAG: exo-alpha-sialidase [Acidobacteriota bacterium]
MFRTAGAVFFCAVAAAAQGPAALLADPAALASPKQLQVVPSRTSSIYRAEAGQWQFNLHSYVTHFEGRFWAIWSSGRVDEDSPSQLIRYSTSADGHRWETPKILVDDPDGEDKPGRWIARGIYVQDGKLQALNAYVEGSQETPRGRESWRNLRLVRFEWNGKGWQNRGTYLDNCMNNYPPRVLDGHLFMTCRDSFAKMHTARAESTSGTGWTVTALPGAPPHDKMSEPSWYTDSQGVAHLIFRDGGRSHLLHHSLSQDGGKTWSAPVQTNYPDATSKNIAGRLSNGWYFLVNNPDPKSRDPLAISFSRDGWTFDKPRALRMNAPTQRFGGRAKTVNSFQYPHVLEKDGSLWVICSTNKEDIEISQFKIADFGLERLPERLLSTDGLLRDPLNLPEAPGRRGTVFRGEENKSGFNLHSYLAHHDGKFWAIWSSSAVGEEDPDQHILYATSKDGLNWSSAKVLVADPDGPQGPARWIARGIYVDQGKLTALGAYIESADYGKRGKAEVWKALRLMRFEWTGKGWEPKGVFADNCMNNFPPERLGAYLSLVCRDSNMTVKMALADAPGANAWKFTPLAAHPPYDKMDEPTYYATGNGEVHMIVRDNSRSGYLLRAISRDYGQTWSQPVRTNYPDATSKNFPGRLSNGWYFLINNPNPKARDPLAISFSRDGWEFSHSMAIRKNAPPRRFAGRAKGSGSMQYPHAIEHGGSLWVIYSTNKEDIEVAELPLKNLELPR